MARRFKKRWMVEDVWNILERVLGVMLMTMAGVITMQALGWI
jgi:hypothetical protein